MLALPHAPPSRSAAAACAIVLLGVAGSAFAQETLNTRLTGYEEVPAVSSTASGRFKAKVDRASQTLHYELSYADLQGDVRQSHIHIGQRSVNGGITVWLCQTPGTPTVPLPTTPTCPQSGAVSGVVSAADVIGPAGQGVSVTEFTKVLDAIRAGVAYVNVHTARFPGGEIRGQLRDGD